MSKLFQRKDRVEKFYETLFFFLDLPCHFLGRFSVGGVQKNNEKNLALPFFVLTHRGGHRLFGFWFAGPLG
jgi:hypothetical protein